MKGDCFYNMKKFHNVIKKNAIDKYTTEIDSSLLDLASSKGGDILKWNNNKLISNVYALDIDDKAIREAIRRRNSMKIRKNIFFQVKDLSSEALKCHKKFNVITCFFAFHYFLKDSSSLSNITQTLRNCSKKGTMVLMTLFEGEKMKDVVSENFYINLKSSKKAEIFIRNCHLQKDINEPSVEYVVKKKFLIETMKENSFDLVESVSFEELYNNQNKFRLSEEEKKLSFLNRLYVFIKV